MATARLTEGRIKAFRPRKTVQDVRDASLKGFGIRVYPTGRKRYFIHTNSKDNDSGRSSVMPQTQA